MINTNTLDVFYNKKEVFYGQHRSAVTVVGNLMIDDAGWQA